MTPARRTALPAVLALAALSLAGCESIMVATGLRVRLDDAPLKAVTASLPGDGRLAPGGKATLAVVATTIDGRTLATAGPGGGKVLPDSYVFEVSGGATVDEDGVVRLPADPRATDGATPHVRLHAKGQDAPVAEVDIPVRYDVAFTARFAGRDGWDGSAGTDGTDGSPGRPGSLDPANPAGGGDGGNGGNGWNGGDGQDGEPGPDVTLTVALVPGAHPLLHVRASATRQKDQFFIVDPAGGSLALSVSGGHGGTGGAGGKGGAGGAGGDGTPPGTAGMDGMDGLAGHDGWGGAAGHVTIAVDPAAAPYLDRLHVTNLDGNGRPGTPPAVIVGPAQAPW